MNDEHLEISPHYFRLQNGRQLLVRGITPEDKYHFRNGIKRLSEKSTFYRFNTPLYEMSEHDLGYFTEIDQVNHVAIGAIDLMTMTSRGLEWHDLSASKMILPGQKWQLPFLMTIKDRELGPS